MRPSYIYCGICGRTPRCAPEGMRADHPNRPTADESLPNFGPVKWWDPDDGWKIGTLCTFCMEEVTNDKPKEGDYAYENQDNIDVYNTDEDPSEALY